jgi:hypothetical protein
MGWMQERNEMLGMNSHSAVKGGAALTPTYAG